MVSVTRVTPVRAYSASQVAFALAFLATVEARLAHVALSFTWAGETRLGALALRLQLLSLFPGPRRQAEGLATGLRLDRLSDLLLDVCPISHGELHEELAGL